MGQNPIQEVSESSSYYELIDRLADVSCYTERDLYEEKAQPISEKKCSRFNFAFQTLPNYFSFGFENYYGRNSLNIFMNWRLHIICLVYIICNLIMHLLLNNNSNKTENSKTLILRSTSLLINLIRTPIFFTMRLGYCFPC